MKIRPIFAWYDLWIGVFADEKKGMGCGLEDRGIRDRYDAMQYGWDKAMSSMNEKVEYVLEIFDTALKES